MIGIYRWLRVATIATFLHIHMVYPEHIVQELFNQAIAYYQQEKYLASIEALQHALSIAPYCAALYFHMGNVLLAVGMIDKSIAMYDKAIECDAQFALIAAYNIGYVLKIKGRTSDAIAIFDTILEKHPDYEQAHLGRAFAYFMANNYETGWQHHNWNLQKQNKFAPELRKHIEEGNLSRIHILLVPEGGLGDTIQFIGLAQELHTRGARITAVVQPPLVPLISLCPYLDKVIPNGAPREPHHAIATYMSLATILATTTKCTILPRKTPYLEADPNRIEAWRSFFEQDKNFKIGVCWQADMHNDISRLPIARRGIPLQKLLPCIMLPGTSWYCLQKIEGLDQLHIVKDINSFHVFDETFDTTYGAFMDTAAVMMHLDLIITIDTAVAHLAGALDRNVWLMLPYSTDWRWPAHGESSPWYPSMRVFKQPRPFDWDAVTETIRANLQQQISVFNLQRLQRECCTQDLLAN